MLLCCSARLCFCGSSSAQFLVLLGFAYPLYTFSLVVLHVAFVFVVTVSYAVLISQIISVWDRNGGCKRYWILLTISGFSLLLFFCVMYIGIMFVYGLTFMQGFLTTDGAHAVVFFLPSLALYLIGRLIQKRFFSDTGM